MLEKEHSNSVTVKPVRRRRSRWVLVGSASTAVAVILSLGIAVVGGFQYFDWLSPPFGIVGFVCGAYAMAEGLRPRGLASTMFVLNMAYWIFFCIGLAARS